MRVACIFFVAGAWILQQQGALPETRYLAVAIAASLAFAAAAWASLPALARGLRAKGSDARLPPGMRLVPVAAVAAVALVLGFSWASFRAAARLADELPGAIEGRDVTVVGTVETLPYVFAHGVRFDFRIENVGAEEAGRVADESHRTPLPRYVSLSWYSDSYPGDGEADGAPLREIEPGARWQLTVRLKKPHGNANPDGFDYEYWLLEQNLRATGTVRPSGANRRVDPFVWSFGHVIERMRTLLRARILDALPDAPYAGVITALVVGDQRAIGQSDWQVYNRTGIGHLISISGLHITMIAGLAAAIVLALWRRSPALMFRLPAHKAAALAGALVALLYCLLAGFGVPAQRTLYMLAMVALALWNGRFTSASRVLCMALLVVVAIDPWAVMAAGFWLSFGAVAAIFYVTSGRVEETIPAGTDGSISRREILKRRALLALRQGARIQWAVTLGIAPMTMLLFHQVSIVSPIANAIAIPLVSLVVTPLALLGALLSAPQANVVGTLLLHAAHGLMAALAALLGWMSASPIAVWACPAPAAWAFVCAMIGVAWCLAPRGIPMRPAGLLWLVPLFAWPGDRPAPDSVRLTALDVGQGMAVLVETAHHVLLYDTGPQYWADKAGENNAGSRVILPYLRARGIERLDAMIVSHNDNDHSGGALSILAQMPVGRVYSSLAEDSAIVSVAGAAHRRCETGERWSFDGIGFEMLHPEASAYGQPALKTNAKSCVLRVTLGPHRAGEAPGRSALLAGDIERPQELELVAQAETNPTAGLRSDVLLVPHHGSLTSSSEPFLDAVQPRVALIQAGYRNRFGHPKAEVVQRYLDRGVQVERNDEDGAITVVLDGDAIRTDAYRTTHRRYWYGR